MAMRVCVRNTFITFDEGDEPRISPKASPRSRSVECASPRREECEQIAKLNKILDDDEEALREIRSPVLVATPLPQFDGPGRIRADSFGSSGASSPPEQEQISGGPSPQELKQLKQRLKEVCQHGYNGGTMHRAASNNSVWSLGSEATEDGNGRGLRHVHSHGSMSSVTSFEANRSRACSYGSICSAMEETDEPVEFDLVEYSEDHPKPEPRERDGRISEGREGRERRGREGRRRKKQDPGPNDTGPKPVGLVDECPSPTASPTSWSPRQGSITSRASSPSGDKSKVWQKEYRHSLVPKTVNLQDEYLNQAAQDITTLMIRNIPNRYSQRDLISELEDLGFAGKFNFLYIPLDKGTMANVGYAFVNFISKNWAQKCMEAFREYRFKRHRKTSGKIASISAAHLQGLEANLAHYERAVVNTAKLKQRRPVVIANISSSLE
ncbi:unnamed protein product [Effrenium voratum]|uniref:RRM domain-containing protein n=1 Tax=Effrenium voratum TaxID=2562239 RepID=A0AA36IB68_9DINO|nr:unnamed protein product [Effrenium voratum]CAJ1383558.1 unnamed protein product [Effrenium voratum]